MNKNIPPIDELLAKIKLLLKEIESLKARLIQLQNSFKLYKTTFDTISESICLIDEEGTILLHNKATETLLNKKSENIKCKKCYEVVHDSEFPIADCPINKMKISHKKESLIILKDKKWLEISVEPINKSNGNYKGIVHVVKDITEKVEIEKKIRLSEEKFFKAFHLGPDVFYISKIFDGELIEVNDAFCNITGFSREEAIGKTSIELNLWANTDDRNKYVSKLKEKGKALNLEFLFNFKNNEKKFGLLSAEFITVDNESCILGIIHDITERKEREEKIKAQNEEIQSQNEEYKQINKDLLDAKQRAEESDKLKTAFLQNISHEIRTPMNGIMGFTNLLLKPNLTEDNKRKYIDIIHSNCQGLLGIINDIIDISRIERGQVSLHLSEFNLNKLFDELEQFFTPSARIKDLKLICKKGLSEEESIIVADDLKIKQVLNNLINNALKFTMSGFIEYGYFIKNNLLEFYVKDSGIGIPKDKFENIFERFRQIENEIKESRVGIGLGLSISKALVSIMNGQIYVTSEINKGSTFYFTIPFKSCVKKYSATNEIKINIKNFTDKNILIVEDDDSNLLYLKELISDTNANVFETKSGIEAVQICKNNPEIDVVLMDIKLPDIDGFEATRRIREFNKTVPIIAQTAYAFTADKEKSLVVGCNDYFPKPIDSDLLIKKLEIILR